MLDLELYERIRLRKRPWFQRLVADGFLRYDYRKVAIDVHGEVPPAPVIFAMNHTDNFNYWPFQYHFHRRGRYTATWVKGKNYEHPAIAMFMRLSNTIPIASRGYLITRDFHRTTKRRPTMDEYRAIRDALNAGSDEVAGVPADLLEQPRDLFGYRFDPRATSYPRAIDTSYRRLMSRFVALNVDAHQRDIDLLVFPQGSRSIRLSKGHSGLAQIATHLGATIVPVGCSGSPTVYPGKSFRAEPGHITYRIGAPLSKADYQDLAPAAAFVPFSREAEKAHQPSFDMLVDRVMHRINDLLDEEYQFNAEQESDGTQGVDRFL